MVDISSINRFFLDSVNRIRQQEDAYPRIRQFKRFSAQFSHAVVVTVLCLTVLCGFPAQSLADAAIPTEVMSAVDGGADIAAEKIDQFSQAYLQVLELLSDRESEIPAAETNAEALKIEKSIEADAIAIIQNSGLTQAEYMQILGLASQDATFQDKVIGRMDDAKDEP